MNLFLPGYVIFCISLAFLISFLPFLMLSYKDSSGAEKTEWLYTVMLLFHIFDCLIKDLRP